MVDPNLDPNAVAGDSAPPAGGEENQGENQGETYWDSFVSGVEYTKESVGAMVTYSYPSGEAAPQQEGGQSGAPTPAPAPAGGAAPEGEGQSGETSWGNVTRQTTEATSAIGHSLSSWYYGKEGEGEGEERQPGFQDTLGQYASYVYTTGQDPNAPIDPNAPPASEPAAPVDPNAPYLGSWFLPEEKEGETPVEVEKVNVDEIVVGFFSGTGTALQKMADYGPAPPSRVKPPASPTDATPPRSPASTLPVGSSSSTPSNMPPRRPVSQSGSSGRAPPPRPSSVSKGMISGGNAAAAPPRPTSMARPAPSPSPSPASSPASSSPMRSPVGTSSPSRNLPTPTSQPLSGSSSPARPCDRYLPGFGASAGTCRSCKKTKTDH